MLVLGETPLYILVLYGIWVVIAITVYIISGTIITKREEENDETSWNSKAQSISLTPLTGLGPSKLSKEVIQEKNFIQIRKKSIDVLAESPYNVNVIPANSRQRKMSNVHFGPVVAEELSPVLPNTPKNVSNSNFGFGEKSKYTDESDDSNDKGEEETSEEDTASVNSSGNSSVNSRDSSSGRGNSDAKEVNKSIESLASIPSNGGSVRITRHSSRAHTKASEIFQRSNSFSRPNHLTPSISINSESPLLTSPTIEQHPRSSPVHVEMNTINSDEEEEEPAVPKHCPFNRSANSDSVIPLQQRRQRRTGLEMEIPKPDNLSIGRPTPTRSPSRSPSFTRKYATK